MDITSIYGDIGGTGNITVEIYLNQTQKYQSSVVSPVYVPAANTGASNSVIQAADEVSTGILDIPLYFNVGKDQDCLVKATRATTGTTGGIGVRTEVSK